MKHPFEIVARGIKSVLSPSMTKRLLGHWLADLTARASHLTIARPAILNDSLSELNLLLPFISHTRAASPYYEHPTR